MTKALVRNAAQDASIGAVLGSLLASALLASSLDLQQVLVDSQAPLTALATIVGVIVTQCAIAAGLAGLAVRQLANA
jgi:hypothetical protein